MKLDLDKDYESFEETISNLDNWEHEIDSDVSLSCPGGNPDIIREDYTYYLSITEFNGKLPTQIEFVTDEWEMNTDEDMLDYFNDMTCVLTYVCFDNDEEFEATFTFIGEILSKTYFGNKTIMNIDLKIEID